MIKLLKNLKPYTMALMAIVVLMLLRTFSELMLPRFMSNIVDIGILNGDTNYILETGMIMLGVAFFGGATSIFSSYLSSKVGIGFARDLRNKVFTKVTSYSMHEIDQVGAASLITRSTITAPRGSNAGRSIRWIATTSTSGCLRIAMPCQPNPTASGVRSITS